jgi:hypothetical protein
MQRRGEGERNGNSTRFTWFGTVGALLIMVIALVFTMNRSEPEVLVPVTANLEFSGPSLQGKEPNPIAVRLHNFIVMCATGDMGAAAEYIDPRTELSGLPEVACGPVIGMINSTVTTRYRFDRLDEENDDATVYVATQEPQRESERYTFYMRKLKGKWYFSVP